MDKKVFRVGQLAYIVMASELYGLEVIGISIIPVTIATQLSKNRYAVRINSLGESIVLPINIENIFSSIAEANEEQMTRLTDLSNSLKNGLKGIEESIKSEDTKEMDRIINELD